MNPLHGIFGWILEFGFLYACAKLAAGRWPYPLAAALFVILMPSVLVGIEAVAELLVRDEITDLGGILSLWAGQVFVMSTLLKFIGAWLLFYLLDRYEDEEIAWLGILLIGFIILVVVL